MRRSSGSGLPPLLAALVAAAGIAWGLVDPPTAAESGGARPDPGLTEDARALLGGLRRGEKLVGWTVTQLSGPDAEGVIRIELSHRALAFSLLLAPKGSQPEQAPVETEHWAVFYGHVVPKGEVLPSNVIRATTNALA
ncbi:MAG: hypothetical protein AAF721_12665, partial [Myxococcota bacterium]